MYDVHLKGLFSVWKATTIRVSKEISCNGSMGLQIGRKVPHWKVNISGSALGQGGRDQWESGMLTTVYLLTSYQVMYQFFYWQSWETIHKGDYGM